MSLARCGLCGEIVDLAEVQVCTGCGKPLMARRVAPFRPPPVQLEARRDSTAGRWLAALSASLLVLAFFTLPGGRGGVGCVIAGMVGILLVIIVAVVRGRLRADRASPEPPRGRHYRAPGPNAATIIGSTFLAVLLVLGGAVVLGFIVCLSGMQ
jgi:hypothetical protein